MSARIGSRGGTRVRNIFRNNSGTSAKYPWFEIATRSFRNSRSKQQIKNSCFHWTVLLRTSRPTTTSTVRGSPTAKQKRLPLPQKKDIRTLFPSRISRADRPTSPLPTSWSSPGSRRASPAEPANPETKAALFCFQNQKSPLRANRLRTSIASSVQQVKMSSGLISTQKECKGCIGSGTMSS